jgi:hypothetical protein
MRLIFFVNGPKQSREQNKRENKKRDMKKLTEEPKLKLKTEVRR